LPYGNKLLAVSRTEEDEALLAVARAVMGISTRAAARVGGISVVQLRALTVLREFDSANLGRLAEAMRGTVSTTSRLVDRLVAAGLVERRPSARSRREITLQVTPEGRTALDRYDDLRLSGLRARLAEVTDRASGLIALEEFAGVGRRTRVAAGAALS